MFEATSRYAGIETATTSVNGRSVTYVRRRFVPRAESLPLAGLYIVREGDRLDNVAAACLGDPEQFWQLADANDAMEPERLVARPGRMLRIPGPSAVFRGPSGA